MMEVCMSVALFALEALAVIVCLHALYGKKCMVNTNTVGFIVFDVLWMEIVHYILLDQIWTLLIYPIIALYCIIEFGYEIKKIIINFILCIVCVGIIQATVMLLFSVCLGMHEIDLSINVLVNAITFLLLILILKKVDLHSFAVIMQGNDKILVLSLGTVIVSVAVLVINYKQNENFNILFYVILGVSLVLITMAAIDIGKHKISAKEAEAELRLHKLYEASFGELIDEICARQHEFDNHINAIYSQHRVCKTYEELVDIQKKYCDEILEENHFNKILSKGNPVMLCFLYSKFGELKKEGITVNYRVQINNLECKMPVYKMIELIGNLVKNAKEAVQKNNKSDIGVSVIEDNNKICIEVSNPNDVISNDMIKKIFEKGYSEKGKGRGYGLYNVKKICEEYMSAIICENEKQGNENRIVFKIMINKCGAIEQPQ